MPRILTNRTGLPSPLFLAIKNDTYEARGFISVTSLIDAPYQKVLRKFETYTEDAADSIWALQGQAIHHVIERVGKGHSREEFLAEHQMSLVVLGRELTGTADLIENQYDLDVSGGRPNIKPKKTILHDFKNIFVWAAKLGVRAPSYKKWIQQTNIYAEMYKQKTGIQIDEILVHAFIRDWSRNRADIQDGYPLFQVQTYNIPIYSSTSIMQLIESRIKLHIEAEDLYKRGFGDKIPVCTEEDRWTKPETWRMMKEGGKRSLKNFSINSNEDRKQAQIYYATKLATEPKLYVDKSPGEDTRCVNYCPVNSFCSFYKANYVEDKKRTDGYTEATVTEKNNEGGLLPQFDF